MEGARRMEAKRDHAEYRFLDVRSPSIAEALAQASIYEKRALVHARRADSGEGIDTILHNGHAEKNGRAHEGDWIVTNPHGEEYLVPEEEFALKYEATQVDGLYRSKGFCRAIPNPYGGPVEIEAGRGETMRGDEDCLIATACDRDGNLYGEPYIIAKSAFEATYLPAGTGKPQHE